MDVKRALVWMLYRCDVCSLPSFLTFLSVCFYKDTICGRPNKQVEVSIGLTYYILVANFLTSLGKDTDLAAQTAIYTQHYFGKYIFWNKTHIFSKLMMPIQQWRITISLLLQLLIFISWPWPILHCPQDIHLAPEYALEMANGALESNSISIHVLWSIISAMYLFMKSHTIYNTLLSKQHEVGRLQLLHWLQWCWL